ncbi:DUF5340 domain-containing protein [Leptolyngbya sp. PCC 6406]|uniref:DUF5340 domain-containing protein n=1 Tax=Leptolyngbya sp. PCC 6406 TaxID=1173264 RepID=UPI0002AC6DF0|nr:DUF5340 domain-containing protein [Leptolyngbya sp. PCC 6406]
MEKPIPLPSHIHYELLMQLLERQTLPVAYGDPHLRSQVSELIIILRKALSQQRQLEEECRRVHLTVDYRWSLNDSANPRES